ncbi:MAG: CDP-alcohol phosphatidyltransferase family protein, partial [Planctomycetes bacterium]|nr:CDP-alcohol phosphatidyltransferase family protein [Planctomycetota bacterium]
MERLVSILISGVFALTVYVWLLKILAKKNVVKYMRAPARWWLHPNAICVWRGLMAWVGLWFYFFTDYYFLGIFLFTNSAFADAYDGEIARSCNLITEFGAEWDPIWDKYTYLPALIFFALFSDLLLVEEVAVFGLIELIWVQLLSRRLVNNLKKNERYAKLSISANNFGKIKTVLCFSLIIYCSLLEDGLSIPNFSRELLLICIFLSLASGAFKLIPNRLYADILSFLNLGCGIAGIVFISHGQYVINVLCVLTGQIFDVLDGRMAHKHGSTKLGPKLDDIADMVSFGINPAIMIMTIGKFTPAFVILGIMHASLV